jgi:uncharacterized repeat protein (TIGR03803 family)
MNHSKGSLGQVLIEATTTGLVLCCLCSVGWECSQAQTFSVLYSFTGGLDGGNPETGLTIDQAGNFYGTAFDGGGPGNGGAVFKFAHSSGSWDLITLYTFSHYADMGGAPDSLLLGSDGEFYGTNYHGGVGDNGTVYRLQPAVSDCKANMCSWSGTALYDFMGSPDGSVPTGGLTLDQAGNLYGSTQYGGLGYHNPGTIYELTPFDGSWIETQLYAFTGGLDGSYINGVVMGADGNLYGTALYGGLNFQGTVFELVHSESGWSLKILHAFTGGNDGLHPSAGLTFDRAGNLFGTTSSGGAGEEGTLFELMPFNGNWTFQTVYNFPSIRGCGPSSVLTIGADGSLYGSSYCGGVYNAGTVFKLTDSGDSWTETVLHVFTGGSDGSYPVGTVTLDANGYAYGVTAYGGITNPNCAFACGVIWEISP